MSTPSESNAPSQPPKLLPSAFPKEDDSSTIDLQPPPSLTPFFTLISDSTTSTTHHPTVHYIFSDDDSGLITNAALHIHDELFPSHDLRSPRTPRASTATTGKREKDKDRFILLTLAPDAQGIESAHSMTPDWQVLSASIGTAPTLDDGKDGSVDRVEGAEGSWEKGMMVKIEGVEMRSTDVGKGVNEDVGLDELVEIYGRRMGELRRVVEAGGGVVR